MKPEKASEAPAQAVPAKAPAAPAVTEAPAKAEEKPAAPAKAEKAPAKEAKPKAAPKAPAKAEKAPAKADDLEAPADRKALDAMVKKHGADAAIKALSKVKVVDLRALARKYNGEFGIAGREIRNANKKVLIEEFSKYLKK